MKSQSTQRASEVATERIFQEMHLPGCQPGKTHFGISMMENGNYKESSVPYRLPPTNFVIIAEKVGGKN